MEEHREEPHDLEELVPELRGIIRVQNAQIKELKAQVTELVEHGMQREQRIQRLENDIRNSEADHCRTAEDFAAHAIVCSPLPTPPRPFNSRTESIK